MGVNQLLACLAVVATSGLGATARQGSGLSHVLRTVESSIDGGQAASRGVIPEPDASQASFATGALEDGISNAADYTKFVGLPLTGAILTDDGSRVVHVSNFRDNDKRGAGKNSYYVSTSSQTHKPVVFLFDVNSDGLLLQAVETLNSSPVEDGRYFPTDVKYPGYVRVIVHSGTKFASIWQFVEIDGKRYLQIKENRFTPATNGWYLAVPPDSKRDKHSEYIAVTPDIEKAMPVSTKPLTKDDIAALKAEQAVLNEED